MQRCSGEDQLSGPLLTNHERQKNSRHRRINAKLDLRLTKPRALGSNHDIARRHDLTATAESSAIDNRDRRLCYLLELPKDRMKRIEHLKDCFLNVIFNRDAGAKRAARFVRIENYRDNFALRALAQCVADLAHHLDVKDVQGWTRKRDSRYTILNSMVNMLIRHLVLCADPIYWPNQLL
jgi:hypothetical protein